MSEGRHSSWQHFQPDSHFYLFLFLPQSSDSASTISYHLVSSRHPPPSAMTSIPPRLKQTHGGNTLHLPCGPMSATIIPTTGQYQRQAFSFSFMTFSDKAQTSSSLIPDSATVHTPPSTTTRERSCWGLLQWLLTTNKHTGRFMFQAGGRAGSMWISRRSGPWWIASGRDEVMLCRRPNPGVPRDR